MKLNPDKGTGNLIRSFSPGQLRVNDELVHTHVIITAEQIIPGWSPAPIAELSLADFQAALDLDPELILFGSGPVQRFPGNAVITSILKRGVGFEVMDTAAACRTFNVLVAEYRHVAAALLIAPEGS